MVNFLAELSIRFDHEIHLTPSNAVSRVHNIYELDITVNPPASFWTEWGGTYDNFQGTHIELYLGQFLEKVYSWNNLLATPNSLYLRNDSIVFVNIPNHPWLYPRQSIEAQRVAYFLYSALNPEKPSMNRIKGDNVKTILELPKLTVKLSDNISGTVLNQGFSVSLVNNDGYFDNEEDWNVFNTPLRLKKTLIDNPEYDDFRDIRVGLIENTLTSFDSFQAEAGDRFRTMDNPVCDIITNDRFPSITIDEKSLNKNIPIVYGKKRVKLQKVNETMYLAAEFFTQVHEFLNSAGLEIPFTVDSNTFIISFDYSAVMGVYNKDNAHVIFTYTNGLLKTVPSIVNGNEVFPDIDHIVDGSGSVIPHKYNKQTGIITFDNADTAIITGYTANKIGEIIKDLVFRKAGIPYTDANWNIEETERYLEKAPRVNFIVENGNVRNAIQNVLKNTMAFFIQRYDGLLTIRRYGDEYATHMISSWAVTQKPEKTWGSAQENYFSSCIIRYDKDGDTFKSFLYNDREYEAEDTYRRLVRREFDTDLTEEKEAAELAEVLSDRYSTMMQTIKVPVGIDTSSFQLLDRVEFSAGINDRKFSNGEIFIIKEIDPAQDILTLEEIHMWDVTGEYHYTEDHEYDVDGLYAYTPEDEYQYDFDGGIL